jgi:hypothetical protein
LGVNTGDIADPSAPVTIVHVDFPPQVTLAPVAGALKVTGTPASLFPPASVTYTMGTLGKAMPRRVLCGEVKGPLPRVIRAGGPAMFVK